MIVDTLDNTFLYAQLYKGFDKAFQFLKNFDSDIAKTGKYEIEGDLVCALVQEYHPLPEKELLWETHLKYIDIQYIFSGRCTPAKMQDRRR